ncbi:MAG TPA: ferritin-like domain-containing protein [Longimicrobiales bacterium]|nr:ferritin-like domain-containing protein [Longimicrobiales bacterium]
MALDSLEKLFVEELKDTYNAEKQLTKALKKMAKNAADKTLSQAFTDHLAETEKQVERLEQVFDSIDMAPKGKTCEGIKGIIAEGDDMMAEDGDDDVKDAALIASAQRAEHYEIAAYGTLRHYADRLGYTRAEQLLSETLNEEKAADEKLNRIAKELVNPKAQMT